MGLFSSSPTKEDAQGHKAVVINGMRFTIRRIVPLLDFPADKLPQIFTQARPRNGRLDPKPPGPEQAAKAMQEMASVLRVGVVDPVLVRQGDGEAKGKEPTLTAEDLFRHFDTAPRLYAEIMAHSMSTFKGRNSFFLTIRKLWLSASCRNLLGGGPANSPSEKATA